MLIFQSETIIGLQYCVISTICTLALIYFIIVTDRSAEHSAELLFYKLAMGFAALCSFTDILYAIREFGMIQMGSAINYGSEILYSLGSICGAYCWFIYSEKKQQSHAVSSSRIMKLYAVPFAVMSLFTLTTPLHHLCFSLSGSRYVRGILNVPFTIICIAFIAITGIRAIINSFSKKYYSRSILLRLLFLYAIVLIIAQMLQVLLGPILPFRSLFAGVLFMFITLRGMCETVTLDALTHINNRFSLDRTLDTKILSGEKFWLVMLDIDNFKHINDTFGHINGDEAIRCTAMAISHAVPHNCFVARYGGDEFAVVMPFEDGEMVDELETLIRQELQQIVNKANLPFSLDISAGYAVRDESIGNIPDMVEAADRVLYERKRSKKEAILFLH